MSFVHLHTHTHFSLLDGLPKIKQLVGRTKALGMPAVAITDHGTMFGVIDFYKEAKKQGIKPIIGIETYVAPNKLTDKRAKIDDSPYHLILLAETNEGYQNLLKLATIAHLEGFYYKPRVDHEVLAKHSKGLIALSGCLGSELSQAILNKGVEAGREVIKTYKEIFGDNNYFLEIQSHPNMVEQNTVNEALIKLATETNTPLVATKDSHYLEKEDAEAQDALVCVQTGKLVTDTKRLNMTDIDLHFASPDTMREAFSDLPEAISNTLKIAERCNVEIKLGTWIFPDFPIPDGLTADEFLAAQVADGLIYRYTEQGVSDSVKKRAQYELDVIKTKGYSTYFLVMADLIEWSRQAGIVTTTRGSAAGSLVAYSLGITTVDPLLYRLPFERFLNPYRPSPPDIDLDIADDRRDEAIAFVKEKYGADKVAQIVTFGTMLARAAVRDIGRVLGYPYALPDRIAKAIPLGSQGFPMTIEKALHLEGEPEFGEMYKADTEIKRIVDLAKKVEGCARHASVHAAGVVITPKPLVEYMPLMRESGGEKIITQYEMHACEDIGVLKMDFLGIRNLAIIGSAIKLIKKIHDIDIDLTKIPLDDKKTYELLARGETVGLFQLGGSGMTRYLKELKPSTVHDIMAMVALFRPGPMNNIPDYIKRKHDHSQVSYLHPSLQPILERSYGILTYQDDLLYIAIDIAGYNWEEADKFRKAVGKKIPEEMDAQKDKFISGCINNGGWPAEKAQELWELIVPFAAYGFNKAHAASYGMVAYQTAYLKANYPSEYMTAIFMAEHSNQDKIGATVEECRRMGIEVLPPNINQSRSDFTRLDEKHIRFGLSSIKNIGEEVTEAVVREREQYGEFLSLEDFLCRIRGRNFNKKLLESLIKSGAMDDWGERGMLLANLETMLTYGRQVATMANSAQTSLFAEIDLGGPPPLRLETDVPPADKKQCLTWEKELLGLYVTEHPLQDYSTKLQDITIPLSTLTNYRAEDVVAVAGIVESIRKIITKKGDPMCFVKLGDISSVAELIVFPSTFEKSKEFWEEDKLILLAGKVSRRDGEAQIIVDVVEDLSMDKFSDTIRRWSKLSYRRREVGEDIAEETIDAQI